MQKWLLIFLGFVTVLSCSDPTELTYEEQKQKNAAHNDGVLSGIGNIFIQDKYEANQQNTAIVSITVGEDTVVYFGSTNSSGDPVQLNGFVLHEKKTGNNFFMKVDRENNRLVMESSVSENVFLEIASLNDTLYSVSGYRIDTETKEKTILFETLKQGSSSGGRQKQSKEAQDETDEQLRDVQKTALTSSHDLGTMKALFELDDAMKKGNINPENKAALQAIIKGVSKGAVTTDDSFLDNLPSFLKTPAKKIGSLIDWPSELYAAYKILDLYELSSVEGDQQTVYFGQVPEPLLVNVTFDGKPAKHITVYIEAAAGFDSRKYYGTTDDQGNFAIQLNRIPLSAENSGVAEIKIKVYKGGLINKNTIFTVFLKKRPRVSITMDAGTNNQKGNIEEYLKLPLKVQVRDENGAAMDGVNVVWTDKTGNGMNFPNTYTNEEGIASNAWKMSSLIGTHQAEASIVASEDYVIVSGKALFTATATDNDSTELYFQSAIGNYVIQNYKGNGPNSVLKAELKADGYVTFRIYNDPSWPDGREFGARWSIVKQNGRYYYSESGFWHPAFPDIEVDFPLTYPVTSFRFHNETVYAK